MLQSIMKKKKQQNYLRHPLQGHQPPNKHNRSRQSFLCRRKTVALGGEGGVEQYTKYERQTKLSPT